MKCFKNRFGEQSDTACPFEDYLQSVIFYDIQEIVFFAKRKNRSRYANKKQNKSRHILLKMSRGLHMLQFKS